MVVLFEYLQNVSLLMFKIFTVCLSEITLKIYNVTIYMHFFMFICSVMYLLFMSIFVKHTHINSYSRTHAHTSKWHTPFNQDIC